MDLTYGKITIIYAFVLHFGKVFEQKRPQKHVQKRNWLVFLPNAKCNIETFSRIGLALSNFLAFFSRFHWHFGYQHVSIKIARKNKFK